MPYLTSWDEIVPALCKLVDGRSLKMMVPRDALLFSIALGMVGTETLLAAENPLGKPTPWRSISNTIAAAR